MYNGRFYGNSSMGMSYSPDLSHDVDRFNPSTRANYTASYNPYGYYSPSNTYHTTTYHTTTYGTKQGRYLGNGQYVED